MREENRLADQSGIEELIKALIVGTEGQTINW